MQNRKGIKWYVWLLLAICSGQALYIYVSGPSRPAPAKVVTVTPVSDGGAIYEVLYDSGGATVPFIYRYFLMDLQPSDAEALKKSGSATPFLVTKGTQAVGEVSGNHVKLKTSETIYDFHNTAYFKIDGELNIVKFNLEATLP
ncbi:hypothetical protein [Pseudomonas sp. MH9.3]|jgi:hypothetical protein|uniref:hypothetical protein n=1 Tax=Pseudomonas sp. MH9.3 TaxID=3048630 RepID=UPI002AC9D706|nr:hypothetical protein [Pseudomonas sp. MH9.3]MEB0107974.1 hypothetical protein [Pseudomonas sp. MH9.3]WPX80907.1 hypothetical protein RHM60_07330 [Pseudomonas sp. MH9.3]